MTEYRPLNTDYCFVTRATPCNLSCNASNLKKDQCSWPCNGCNGPQTPGGLSNIPWPWHLDKCAFSVHKPRSRFRLRTSSDWIGLNSINPTKPDQTGLNQIKKPH